MKLRNKKTGEIMDLECITIFDRPDKYNTGDAIDEFYTLAELNEDWEDYEPAEPLIKDEKIRKAVRAWAEVDSIEKAIYAERADSSVCILTDMGVGDYSIEFFGYIQTLKDGEDYTIAELCGEGEE